MNATPGTKTPFAFQRDFGGTPEPPLATGEYHRPLTYKEHQAIIRVAEAAAQAKGFEEGRKAQADAEAQALTAALQVLAARLGEVQGQIAAVDRAAHAEAAACALAFSRHLAGAALDQMPMAAIEATAARIYADLRGAAHVAVRVAPSLVETVKDRLGTLMRQHGVEARLIVFPDPEIGRGDVRIEWAEGGILRDHQRLARVLDEAIAPLLPAGAGPAHDTPTNDAA